MNNWFELIGYIIVGILGMWCAIVGCVALIWIWLEGWETFIQKWQR